MFCAYYRITMYVFMHTIVLQYVSHTFNLTYNSVYNKSTHGGSSSNNIRGEIINNP